MGLHEGLKVEVSHLKKQSLNMKENHCIAIESLQEEISKKEKDHKLNMITLQNSFTETNYSLEEKIKENATIIEKLQSQSQDYVKQIENISKSTACDINELCNKLNEA